MKLPEGYLDPRRGLDWCGVAALRSTVAVMVSRSLVWLVVGSLGRLGFDFRA